MFDFIEFLIDAKIQHINKIIEYIYKIFFVSNFYSHLYNLPTTGLRYFTVYGPWGRPDMAMYIFTDNILNGKREHGNSKSFTRDNLFAVIRTIFSLFLEIRFNKKTKIRD